MTHIALLGTALLDEAIDHQLLTRGIELGGWKRNPERYQKLLDTLVYQSATTTSLVRIGT